LLVCQSGGARGAGMRTLCELTDPEDVASVVLHASEAEGRTVGARFREIVNGFERSHSDPEVVLRPIEVGGSRARDAAPDPVGRLHSRLDTLREAGWGASS
ncbi:MAG: hypothetical protein K8E66_09515, partial [Phycisphaerales bacterium]|nr:hypothetical protein [Phycisphaerales bacterium]